MTEEIQIIEGVNYLALFDNIERTDMDYAKFSEGTFEYLNRTARPELDFIRQILEKWFKSYPLDEKVELRNRFRSNDEQQSLGAFFELYCHQFLLKSGFEVSIHPIIEGTDKRPDFLVSKDNESLFYFECTTSTLSDSNRTIATLESQIIDEINKIKSPDYRFKIEFVEKSNQYPNVKKLRRFLEAKIQEECKRHIENNEMATIPQWTWEDNGWTFNFSPILNKENAQEEDKRPLCLFIHPIKKVKVVQELRNSIKKKATKYGNLNDLPCIIAVNYLGDFGLHDDDIVNALFGKDTITTTFSEGEVINNTFRRKTDGIWQGPNGPRNRKNSGVLLFNKLRPSNMVEKDGVLWHHPWARMPLNIDYFTVSQFVPHKEGYLKQDGVEVWKLLGFNNSL